MEGWAVPAQERELGGRRFCRLDFRRGDEAGEVVRHEIQRLFPTIGAAAFFASLNGQLVIEIRFDFRQDALERRGGQIGIHVLEFLATIQYPVKAFNSAGVMLLFGRIDPGHGRGEGLSLIDEIIETGHGTLKSRIHRTPLYSRSDGRINQLYMRIARRQEEISVILRKEK